MKVNGWIRLWIVLSVAYTVAVVVYAYLNFPTIAISYEEWHNPPKRSATRSQDGRLRVPILTMKDYEMTRMRLSGIEQTYQAYVEPKRAEQQQFMTKITALWLIPIALLYVIGRSIGWIYKGFHKQS